MNKLEEVKKDLIEALELNSTVYPTGIKLIGLYLDKVWQMGIVEGLEKAQQIRKEVYKIYEK